MQGTATSDASRRWLARVRYTSPLLSLVQNESVTDPLPAPLLPKAAESVKSLPHPMSAIARENPTYSACPFSITGDGGQGCHASPTHELKRYCLPIAMAAQKRVARDTAAWTVEGIRGWRRRDLEARGGQ